MKNKIKSLKSIYYWSIFSNFCLLIIIGFFLFFLSKNYFYQSLDKRFSYYQQLFVSSINDNVFMGQNQDVYRKCAQFFNDSDIENLVVELPGQGSICELTKSGSENNVLKLETPIYFNEQSKEVAANVKVTYSLNSINKIIKEIFLFIFLILTLIFTVNFFSSRFFLNKITSPIKYVLEYFNKTSMEQLNEISLGQNDIYEIEILQSGINTLIQKIKEYEIRIMRLAEYEAKHSLAKQLSHDIRSPLAALNMIRESTINILPNEQAKLLEMSINRITDIANTILPKKSLNISSVSKIESNFIWLLVNQLISEKRIQYKNLKDISVNVEFKGDVFSLNARCDQTEFMRALSNIIDNSVEATIANQSLTIDVVVEVVDENIKLSIQDNGCGVPNGKLSKVFDEGFTAGKKSGSGLGLFQAKRSVEQWGGKIAIESTEGVGTKITIDLKKSDKPQWLTDPIRIDEFDDIYVLDDEEYVSQVIRDKFYTHKKKVAYFKSISSFVSFVEKNNLTRAVCFIDYDLKQEENGLSVIQKCAIEENSILLTGNYDDKQVQVAAIKAGVKILPKPLIHEISIVS